MRITEVSIFSSQLVIALILGVHTCFLWHIFKRTTPRSEPEKKE